MTRRFVASFYYVALLNPRDRDHERVMRYHAALTGE